MSNTRAEPREKTFALLLTAAAIGVGLYLSTSFYLNPDEAINVNAGSTAHWAIHHHPPLLLWWLWLATLVSDQEWWLRLPSTLAGGLTPLVMGLWLRRFLSPVTAWGLATFVAFSPNLVMLSIQVRGYSIAMFFTILALYALDRAFEELSRRMLMWHFAVLYLAILSEFCVTWAVLASGLYGVAVFARRPETRRLLLPWLIGQGGAATVYGLLYFLLLRVVLARFLPTDMFATYLRHAFPLPGENWIAFIAVGTLKQFAYVAGSWAGGMVAALLAGWGLVAWYRKGDQRPILVMGMYLCAFAAIAMIHPFGRTRQTAVIGLVSLAAVGAGIDALGRWRAIGLVAPIMALLTPLTDPHNIPTENWRKERLERAILAMDAAIPAGATLMADRETVHMLKARLRPRGERQIGFRSSNGMPYKGTPMIEDTKWDWDRMTATEIRAMAGGPVWVVDMGFSAYTLKARKDELRLTSVIDEPGVCYLGRLP